MVNLDVIKDKKILLVDDEPDILQVAKELLSTSQITTCSTFDCALDSISKDSFDLIILDIMGVNGFALLEASKKRKMPAAMLTAHALNIESLNLSIRLGAISFIPKEELEKLPTLVAEIFEDLEQGKTHWNRLFERFGGFFKEKLGTLWEEVEKPATHPPFYE